MANNRKPTDVVTMLLQRASRLSRVLKSGLHRYWNA
jgi:hypothetical protein